MTLRASFPVHPEARRAPDFTLTNIEASRRIKQLARLGLPEPTIAALYGLSAVDLWRALARRSGA
ncbi:MAG TPA: hypothetical protein VK130_06915 [Steroidobacteraceae bacterium]|nr:hypothetical protein [Steroidobacteraceae bacterium]